MALSTTAYGTMIYGAAPGGSDAFIPTLGIDAGSFVVVTPGAEWTFRLTLRPEIRWNFLGTEIGEDHLAIRQGRIVIGSNNADPELIRMFRVDGAGALLPGPVGNIVLIQFIRETDGNFPLEIL